MVSSYFLKSEALRRFIKNRAAVAGFAFLVFVSAMSAFAPYVTKYSYEEQNIEERLSPPTTEHWFGTDALGRDVYSRVVYGGRVSISVGLITALMALVLGVGYGAVSGYFGGWVDGILMRIVEVFYILPSLLLAILVMVVMGQGLFGILIALGAVGWVNQARLVRGQVLQVREFAFVESARASGARDPYIILRHILPNLWGPILVSLTYQIPSNIIAESFLSFLGLGIQPPMSSWGTLAAEGWRAMRSYPHLIMAPGMVLFLSLLSFQVVGDGLRDVFDPKSKY